MFRQLLIALAKQMADMRILKANYNAKLQKYFIVTVDRETKLKKTWAIPASDVWPSQTDAVPQELKNETSDISETPVEEIVEVGNPLVD